MRGGVSPVPFCPPFSDAVAFPNVGPERTTTDVTGLTFITLKQSRRISNERLPPELNPLRRTQIEQRDVFEAEAADGLGVHDLRRNRASSAK